MIIPSYNLPTLYSKPVRLEKVEEKTSALKFGLGNQFIEFKHVMEPIPVPILITNLAVNILYANSAWEQLTGYKLTEVVSKNPRFLQSGKTDKKLFKSMWRTLLNGKSFTTEDVIDRRKDGTEYQINSVIFPVSQNKRTHFYVQIEQDITNRKKLEDLKSEFLSTATHELKTPITTLKLLIQSQLRKIVKKEFDKLNIRELKLIERELNRLTHIINDLSDVSRIEAGKLKMNMKLVNITYIINDAVRQMKTIAEGHPIAIKQALPIYVVADEDRIKQVMLNLIKNAFKYSYPKSEIIISTAIQGNHCVVSVQNNGAGIPQNKQSYIFDRFYQLHAKDNSGLGLGLYISKKIIEQHKGKVWLESEECKLTTFYFSLVIADAKTD